MTSILLKSSIIKNYSSSILHPLYKNNVYGSIKLSNIVNTKFTNLNTTNKYLFSTQCTHSDYFQDKIKDINKQIKNIDNKVENINNQIEMLKTQVEETKKIKLLTKEEMMNIQILLFMIYCLGLVIYYMCLDVYFKNKKI